MVVKKRRKFRRKRGSRECGWGVFHRGKGHKGGCGKAGTGKRAKAKMPMQGRWSIQKQGKYGFKFKGKSIVEVPINLKVVEDKLNSWIKNKKIVKEGDAFTVDLSKLGFNKLLGSGKVVHKLKIIVDFASKSVVEKVKAKGGEVVLPQPE
ncbi:uL15 family ribosomal protein [Candidatus Woesearchaeota archaeon]|nr:uL15 family ribosomal protein [Candidatus Woesearchaeota archaeon]